MLFLFGMCMCVCVCVCVCVFLLFLFTHLPVTGSQPPLYSRFGSFTKTDFLLLPWPFKYFVI